MKREYYRRLYTCALHTAPALAVFRASMRRLQCPDLLDSVLDRLGSGDVEEFLGLLAETTYDLDATRIPTLLYRHRLTRCAYDRFVALDLRDIAGPPPCIGVYNYCAYARTRNFAFEPCSLSGIHSPAATACTHVVLGEGCAFAFPDATEDEKHELRDVLKEICFRSRNNPCLREYVRRNVRDDLLVAMTDCNGRVNGRGRSPEDLLLVSPGQVYNESDLQRICLFLCTANTRDSLCQCCGSRVHHPEMEGKNAEGTFGMETGAIMQKAASLLENALVEEDVPVIVRLITHCPSLRTAKVLKILLRIFITRDSETAPSAPVPSLPNTRPAPASPSQGECLAKAVALFEHTEETEHMLVSFLKSQVSHFSRVLLLLPGIVRGRRLAFACFAVMNREFVGTSSAYIKICIRRIVHVHAHVFGNIADLVIEHFYSHHLLSGDRSADVQDLEYLHCTFRGLAAMHSCEVSEFVHRYFFNMFLVVYARHRFFTGEFVAAHTRYLVIKSVLDGSYTDQIDDPAVLAGLLFNGVFDLQRFFKPSPREFIRENLSQLLFKIKSGYQSHGCYRLVHEDVGNSRPDDPLCTDSCHVVYKILRFVLGHIRIPLYFNYIWPTIEFFLNKEPCGCAGDFIEWLRSEHCAPAMVAYMRIPFAAPEDLPTAPNIGPKLRTILTRFFTGGAATMNDEEFIARFLRLYTTSRAFRSRILAVYPAIPPGEAAIFGNLRADSRGTRLTHAPPCIPRFILEHFLLRMDYNTGHLHAFVIQVFLAHIPGPLSAETESIVRQFRYTRYEFTGTLPETPPSIDTSSFRSFLVSLFGRLVARAKGYEYFRYLVLFANDVLEYAVLGLLRICHDTVDGFEIGDVTEAVNALCSGDSFASFSFAAMARFLLKVNAFVEAQLVSTADGLRYAFALRDYLTVIFILDGAEASDPALLQLAYYAVGDITRVRGMNTLAGGCTPLGLFFEFCIERNFEAAQHCLREVDVPGITRYLEEVLSASRGEERENGHRSWDPGSAEGPDEQSMSAFDVWKEDPRSIDDQDGCSDRTYAHALVDYRLIKSSENVETTIDLVNARRAVADNREGLLRIHRSMARALGIPGFIRAVELEFVRALRAKKDYAACTRCIAALVLRKEWEALYEHALVKIDQRQPSEARELLKRVISLHRPEDDVYHKAVVKLCEISNSSIVYSQYIGTLEEHSGGGAEAGPAGAGDGSRRGCAGSETHKYLMRLYFLAAKHFEKSSLLSSLDFYYKSFNSNYEAVPRFFHLIADIPKKDLGRVGELVSSAIRDNLRTLIPFYNQISNRLSIQTDSFRFYNDVTRAMLEAAPSETFWESLVLVNSKREDIRVRARALIDGLSISNRATFKATQRIADALIAVSKAAAGAVSTEGVAALLPADVNVPGRRALLAGVLPDVHVFASLQAPKKIVLLGSDGEEHPMIVKAKDDLRKDSRVMDLDGLLNKLFEDGFYIRSYNVIPFTHDAGIIEFVPGLTSLKEICLRHYTHANETAACFTRHSRIGGNNMQRVLALFPPIFARWLRSVHCDPHAFYTHRENFIRTYAIMNIVGWFIGLGDRHAENTHFDIASGDTVHVDLNCIFDRGRSFAVPERVPFRLTQNIIDGFGALRLEGTYKHTLRYTLTVMRNNRDVVLANLLSFVFDPLFEWARKKNEPKRILDALAARLDCEDVDEQVEHLIAEATDVNNLGNMYIGWMAFL